MQLILASSSRYRREMLERLRLPFQCISPSIDETPLPGESPVQTCERLGLLKAKAVANLHPNAIVIGSDQVADVNGEAISKPGHHEAAVAQLTAMSGKSITFHSAVSVVHQASGKEVSFCVPTVVEFRTLNAQEIERYLLAEQPYDCAGSAKSEGLGITLLNRIESRDPTALIGLPLIELSKALRKLGVSLP